MSPAPADASPAAVSPGGGGNPGDGPGRTSTPEPRSTLDRVLDAARSGQAPAVIATQLGLSRGVVEMMLGQGERLGRLDVVRLSGCRDTGACDPGTQAACAACPIRPVRRGSTVR